MVTQRGKVILQAFKKLETRSDLSPCLFRAFLEDGVDEWRYDSGEKNLLDYLRIKTSTCFSISGVSVYAWD